MTFHLVTPFLSLPVRMNLSGSQHVMNGLAALAVAIELGVEPETAAEAVAQIQASSGRGRVLPSRFGGRVVDDTYNANPAAVRAAIDALVRESGHRVLILGAMLELGETSANLHRDIGCYAKAAGVEQLIVVGDEALPAADGFGTEAFWFADQGALAKDFPHLPSPHTVWVKASRGAALERTVDWLVSGEAAESC